MTYANITRSTGSGFAGRIASFVEHLQSARQKSAIYRQTVRELTALSARELNDLGIDRGMIKKIASEAAYGK